MGRIFDAVYGYIELNDIEFKLVNSPVFQRLHWIKQLGPLSTIFPSAQHSRFSHSIGVFHIMSKIIKSFDKRPDDSNPRFSEDDKKILRLAALLHDVGHVPMSHAGERVLEETYKVEIEPGNISMFSDALPAKWTGLFDEEFRPTDAKLHECLSALMVRYDSTIDKALIKYWPDRRSRVAHKQRIAQIIVGQLEGVDDHLTPLLHSELDADRLDYLLRDSFFTGVGYGHVDLDYIISRLVVTLDEGKEFWQLCVEDKGLHTIEHYILGRFFLQTQVVFNRKVRLLDLLFADVMKFMVESSPDDEWHLMDLELMVKIIKDEAGDAGQNVEHSIYEFTDAQVFVKMRCFHDKVDGKLKAIDIDSLTEDEKEQKYINDCIKIIMDGNARDPLDTHQKVINLSATPKIVSEIKQQAKILAKDIAENLGIEPRRIKANVVKQRIMKYKKTDDAETNRESVRITYKKSDGEDKIIYAAESNASVLAGLVDRALVIFNIYYVEDKKESSDIIEQKEKVIKEGFRDFTDKYFQDNPMPCGCESGEHLCQVIGSEGGLEIVKELTKNPQYICRKCGCVSSDGERLCDGIEY